MTFGTSTTYGLHTSFSIITIFLDRRMKREGLGKDHVSLNSVNWYLVAVRWMLNLFTETAHFNYAECSIVPTKDTRIT